MSELPPHGLFQLWSEARVLVSLLIDVDSFVQTNPLTIFQLSNPITRACGGQMKRYARYNERKAAFAQRLF